MVPSDDHTAASLIGRRDAIRRAALLAGVALSPAWLTAIDQVARPAAQGPSLAPAQAARRLTAVQAAIAGAVADRILPRTDTPGAADVGVPAFIDLLYGEYMTAEERKVLSDGLNNVDTAAKAAHGGGFTTLSADRQDTVLRAIARAEEGKDGGFFSLIRSATILGYFTSEPVGRNVLHFDPVPGRFDACVPIDQVGRRNWTV